MTTSQIKTRFAPSPTGRLHLGNIRTALFSALYAHKNGGAFVLRIEDTDQERSKSEYVDALKQDLLWLGIKWQEGPDVNGPVGPYFQSERTDIYDNYYQQLEDSGNAYPCFCTERQLDLSRKAQRSAGKAPKYAGTCRSLNKDEIKQKLAEGLKPTLRFKVPQKEVISYHDFVKGKQNFNTEDIGDFIIRRANGTAAFMFSNSVDDAMMGVTHVMRGDDHLTNTPRQIMILKALGLPCPEYGHISLILGEKDSPLSKRSGSLDIQALRDAEFFPNAILNYIARLGHYYRNNQRMDYAGLANEFELESLNTSAARFNYQQMVHWQKEEMAIIDSQELVDVLPASVKEQVPGDKIIAFSEAIQQNITFPSDAEPWADIIFGDALALTEDATDQLKNNTVEFFQHAVTAFEKADYQYSDAMSELKSISGQKGKSLFQPIRLAITGQFHGPEMKPVFDLMNPATIKARLEHAQSLAQNSTVDAS